jgi:hypothetical protein
MAVGLAAILARARVVVAGLVPATEPSRRFVEVSPDLGIDEEPPAMHRQFEVLPLPDPPSLTRAMLGPDAAQFRGRFEVVIDYDAGTNRDAAQALVLEDSEQIAFALETDSGAPAGTRNVELRGGSLEQDGQFWTRRLTFEATYDRSF